MSPSPLMARATPRHTSLSMPLGGSHPGSPAKRSIALLPAQRTGRLLSVILELSSNGSGLEPDPAPTNPTIRFPSLMANATVSQPLSPGGWNGSIKLSSGVLSLPRLRRDGLRRSSEGSDRPAKRQNDLQVVQRHQRGYARSATVRLQTALMRRFASRFASPS